MMKRVPFLVSLGKKKKNVRVSISLYFSLMRQGDDREGFSITSLGED